MLGGRGSAYQKGVIRCIMIQGVLCGWTADRWLNQKAQSSASTRSNSSTFSSLRVGCLPRHSSRIRLNQLLVAWQCSTRLATSRSELPSPPTLPPDLMSSSTLSRSRMQSRISSTTSSPFFSTSSYLDQRTICCLYFRKAASRLLAVKSITLSLIFSYSNSILGRLREVSSSSCCSIPISFQRKDFISFSLLMLSYSSSCHCLSLLLLFGGVVLVGLLRSQQKRCVAWLLMVSSLFFLGAVTGRYESSVVSAVVECLIGDWQQGTADSECCRLYFYRYCSQQSGFQDRL